MDAIVYLGAGGVGKTTVAAATALAAARGGRRAVVLTVDPARRLADVLGLGLAGNDLRPVAGPWTGELWATQLDPMATLDDALRRHSRPGQAERLLANPTFAALTSSVPGINEYMAVERLHQLSGDERFDLVVVDTPPSRHGIDFLDSPRRLCGFLTNRLYRTALAPRPGVLRPIGSAAQAGLRAAARSVGLELVDNVVRLFADAEGLDEGFVNRATETEALLRSPTCRYRLVTAARAEPVAEAAWIGSRLRERGLTVEAIVANRLVPFGRPAGGRGGAAAATSGPPGPGAAALRRNLDELQALARGEDDLLDGLAVGLDGPRTVRLEERQRPLSGLDDLAQLAAELP